MAKVYNLEKTVDELKEQLKEKESKMDKVKLEQEKKLLKLQNEFQEQINSIKEVKNNEMEEYKAKYSSDQNIFFFQYCLERCELYFCQR